MKKFFITIFLLIIIFLSFGYAFCKFSAASTEDNYFNKNWRGKFARYPIMRQILGLHFDGDAQSDYLGTKYSSITMKVMVMKGLTIDEKIIQGLAEKIEKTTGKKTSYIYLSNDVPFSQTSTLKELTDELKSRRTSSWSSNSANLYLFIANQQEGDQEMIGSTLQEDAIVLFEDMLNKNYLDQDNLDVFDQYAISVLLHEFGHQLGLPHNNLPGCLMNEKSEMTSFDRIKDIQADFCDYEKNQLERQNH